MADRAYDRDPLRRTMTAQGAGPTSSPCRTASMFPAFSPFLYRSRNQVERFFDKLTHVRATAVPLREARDQLPRPRQTRCNANLAAQQ